MRASVAIENYRVAAGPGAFTQRSFRPTGVARIEPLEQIAEAAGTRPAFGQLSTRRPAVPVVGVNHASQPAQ